MMVKRRRNEPAAFVLPRWMRWALVCLAIFVAYSQFISVALTGMYRYDPMEPTFNDGASPKMYAGLTVWEPSWTVRTIAGFADWYTPYRPVRDAVVGVGLATLGSGGFFLSARLRRSWRFPSLIVLVGGVIGIAATLGMEWYQWNSGSTWLSAHSTTATDGPLARYAIHPNYGYVEFVGSLVVPLIAYAAMIVGVIWVVLTIIVRSLVARLRAAR